MKVRLWSINKWLRWSGWRLFIEVPRAGEPEAPTMIGLCWYGWRFVGHEPSDHGD